MAPQMDNKNLVQVAHQMGAKDLAKVAAQMDAENLVKIGSQMDAKTTVAKTFPDLAAQIDVMQADIQRQCQNLREIAAEEINAKYAAQMATKYGAQMCTKKAKTIEHSLDLVEAEKILHMKVQRADIKKNLMRCAAKKSALSGIAEILGLPSSGSKDAVGWRIVLAVAPDKGPVKMAAQVETKKADIQRNLLHLTTHKCQLSNIAHFLGLPVSGNKSGIAWRITLALSAENVAVSETAIISQKMLTAEGLRSRSRSRSRSRTRSQHCQSQLHAITLPLVPSESDAESASSSSHGIVH